MPASVFRGECNFRLTSDSKKEHVDLKPRIEASGNEMNTSYELSDGLRFGFFVCNLMGNRRAHDTAKYHR